MDPEVSVNEMIQHLRFALNFSWKITVGRDETRAENVDSCWSRQGPLSHSSFCSHMFSVSIVNGHMFSISIVNGHMFFHCEWSHVVSIVNGHMCLFWPCPAACGILVPWSGIELAPLALEVQSLNHWTIREVWALDFLTYRWHVKHTSMSTKYAYRGQRLRPRRSREEGVLNSPEVVGDS